jgi:hypothetical protein
MLVERGAGSAGDEADSLARALKDQEPEGERRTATEAAGEVVEEASAVTAKIERTMSLGRGVAEGRALDPEQLSLEVDSLLGLLERLGFEGRWREALRLARALSTLLSLLKRWVALLQTLRDALRAAEKLGDLEGIAWARHQLGALQVAAGDVRGAERNLREAREIRKRLGDRLGLAATDRNMQVLCEQLRQMLREEKLLPSHECRPALLRSPLLLVVFAATTLALGGVAGAIVASGGKKAHGGGPGAPSGVLTVKVTGGGSGTVTSEPPGIECARSLAAATRLRTGPTAELAAFAKPGPKATAGSAVVPRADAVGAGALVAQSVGHGESGFLGGETQDGEGGESSTENAPAKGEEEDGTTPGDEEETSPKGKGNPPTEGKQRTGEERGGGAPPGSPAGGETEGTQEHAKRRQGGGTRPSCHARFRPGRVVVLSAEADAGSLGRFTAGCAEGVGRTTCRLRIHRESEVTARFSLAG